MIDINKSKKKTIITIIGRSGAGKDYIAKRLKKNIK